MKSSYFKLHIKAIKLYFLSNNFFPATTPAAPIAISTQVGIAANNGNIRTP